MILISSAVLLSLVLAACGGAEPKTAHIRNEEYFLMKAKIRRKKE